MDKFVQDKYVDVFRHFYPEMKDKYTWRSYRAGAKERNVGRRLDYFWVDERVLPLVTEIEHQEQATGSDHCPILLTLE
ncbi:MAG: hypothetical protein LBO09_09335 [Candidatus Peribacteria bacterium]|jgi:exodeoxyribonuclease-3|nr:hypothetical protein [Candidatus Peribacteria bacterium]